MKNGRINERNAGHWSLDGEPKTRRAKPKSNALTDEDRVKRGGGGKIYQ